MKRFLSVLLAAILCLSCAAGAFASGDPESYKAEAAEDAAVPAAEPESAEEVPAAETEPPAADGEITVDQWDSTRYYFESFADLKELVSRKFDDSSTAEFTGEAGEFVIEEDITIPENLQLRLADSDVGAVVVPAGVTLTNYGDFPLDLNYFLDLDVKGKIVNYNYMSVSGDAAVTGAENIEAGGYNSHFYVYHRITDEAGLIAAVQKAGAYPEDFIQSYEIQGSMTLDTAVAVPGDFYIENSAVLTVAENGELVLNDWASISGKMVIRGAVRAESSIMMSGVIELDGGSFDCAGDIQILLEDGEVYTDSTISEHLAGFPEDAFELEETFDWYVVVRDRSHAASSSFEAPSDLHWDDRGHMCMTLFEPYGDGVMLNVYQAGNNQPYQNSFASMNAFPRPWGESLTVDGTYFVEYMDGFFASWAREELTPSGDYFFTARVESFSSGEGSETATSPNWHYERPAARLSESGPLQMSGDGVVSFTLPAEENSDGFLVQLGYTASADGVPQLVSSMWNRWDTGAAHTVNISGWGDWIFEQYGPGYYTVRVRAMSADVTRVCHSSWTMPETMYHYTDTPQDVPADLQALYDTREDRSVDEICRAVRQFSADTLLAALEDPNDPAAGILEALESYCFGGGAFGVADSMGNTFEPALASETGLLFNPGVGPVSLILDTPEEGTEIPAGFDREDAVLFSLRPSNLEDPEHLAVPVRITLPLPDGLAPELLAILHFAPDGSVKEVIRPRCFERGGQTFAAFVVTGFSDFAMAEELPGPTALDAAAILRAIVAGETDLTPAFAAAILKELS